MSGSIKPIANISYKECIPNVVPVILLHGLTCSKEYWDECAHIIAHTTGAKVYSLDARNHGDSEWSEENGYDAMAEDLRSFMDSQSIEKAIIVGHSMGGKTGMIFAFRYPERLQCLIVEDMRLTPSPKRQENLDYIQKLKGIPSQIPSHLELSEAKQLAADLMSDGQSRTLESRSWDGSDLPLRKTADGQSFEWKSNLEAMAHFILEGNTTNYVRPADVYTGPVLVVYGPKSSVSVLDDKELFLKHFPNASYVPIEGGAHSLHKEFPDTFCDLVGFFILEQKFVH